MQPFTPYDRFLFGAPGLLIGFIVGYAIGGAKRLTLRDRALIGLSFTLLGGTIIILALGSIIDVGTFEAVLSILSTGAGFGLGLASNWELPDQPISRPKVVFDPEEADKEFDKQLNEALGLDKEDS
ncbi:MAG: hypothetical protein EAX81_06580 [Candidatus Thorarchaeota archaeon]|nr:hypothetical protein [Candidatus Thorarchaeota archaeon]